MRIDISNINKAELLAALYNNSKPQGMGFLQADSKDMTKEEAQELLDENKSKYFDYLKGRVMKIDLSGDTLRTDLYNRDLGINAAEAVVDSLRPKAPKQTAETRKETAQIEREIFDYKENKRERDLRERTERARHY